MRRALVLLAALFALVAMPGASAQTEDTVTLSRGSARIGEQVVMRIRVIAPEGATVELTPGTPTWGAVELVGVDEVTQVSQPGGVAWLIEARVAPFFPGSFAFAPSVVIIQGAEATQVTLPAVELEAVATLPIDAELVLSPLASPTAIPGAESPLLRPAIVAGGLLGSALIALLLWFVGRTVIRRLSAKPPVVPELGVPATLDGAEQILDSDPVGAYRLMSSIVKGELARRYGVRATALTTTELRRQLESSSDRWEARLVGGLLEECDSVIYAGYRPAAERRRHDLTMAREIVEVGA